MTWYEIAIMFIGQAAVCIAFFMLGYYYCSTKKKHLVECTGMYDRWCPIHGFCQCGEVGDKVACPLHSARSSHGSTYGHKDGVAK